MKWYWFLIFPLLLNATDTQKFFIHLLHADRVATKVVIQAFHNAGQKVLIERYLRDGEDIVMEMVVQGTKPFDSKRFGEIVRDNGIVITKGSSQKHEWKITMDASAIRWNVPEITPDEGFQLEKSSVSGWFVINRSSAITIEAPYGNQWYPDVAVLDQNMEVLVSLRAFKPQERLSFELPSEAMYLKVSSTNGMKLLKEGMWIEHATQ